MPHASGRSPGTLLPQRLAGEPLLAWPLVSSGRLGPGLELSQFLDVPVALREQLVENSELENWVPITIPESRSS